MKERCLNCRKYLTKQCEVYKSENKRPGPDDWCMGWRRKRHV
jgi:hypothetical protein